MKNQMWFALFSSKGYSPFTTIMQFGGIQCASPVVQGVRRSGTLIPEVRERPTKRSNRTNSPVMRQSLLLKPCWIVGMRATIGAQTSPPFHPDLALERKAWPGQQPLSLVSPTLWRALEPVTELCLSQRPDLQVEVAPRASLLQRHKAGATTLA